MEKKIWLVGEKLKMLEVIVFENADRKCVKEENREKEWEAMKAELMELKRKDGEKDRELEMLREKVDCLEREKKEEINEIWTELVEWNSEWENNKIKEREAAEQKKIDRFNRKREQELWEGKLNNIEEGLNLTRRRIRINEEEIGRFVKEASKALIELKLELDALKQRREEETEDGGEERREMGIARMRNGNDAASKEVVETEGNKLKIKGSEMFAVTWKEEGKKEEEK